MWPPHNQLTTNITSPSSPNLSSYQFPNNCDQPPVTPSSNGGSNSDSHTTDFGTLEEYTDKRRQCKWQMADDELLASAWLNVSNDAIIGKNQKGISFWNRVAEYYNAERSHADRRTASQCKVHWHPINHAVQKFSGACSRTERKSGMSDDDFLENALQLYDTENGGKKFCYMHVWLYLKNEPKWQDYNKTNKLSSLMKRTKVSESGTYTSSGGDVDLSEDVEEVRPLGQKSSKRNDAAKRKGKEVSSRYAESLNYLKDMEVERLQAQSRMEKLKEKELESRQKEFESKQLELQNQERILDQQVLYADTTFYTPCRRKSMKHM